MEQRRALRKRRLADSDEEEADSPKNAKGENKYKRLLAEDSDDEEAAPAAVSPAKKLEKAADSDSGDESDSSHASQDSGRDVVLKQKKKDEQNAKEVAAGEGAVESGCGGGEEGVDAAPDGVLVVEYMCVYFLGCLEW